jgi:hypothetical protein
MHRFEIFGMRERPGGMLAAPNKDKLAAMMARKGKSDIPTMDVLLTAVTWVL